MTERLEASVIVPADGRRPTLSDLLDGLGAQTVARESFEVVLVLNPATEEALAEAERHVPRLRIVTVTRPRSGRSAACNTGIEAASGELVVLLDDDMAPTPGWLEAHLKRHAERPRLVVMGAVPVQANGDARAIEQWVARSFREHHERLSSGQEPFHLRDFYTGNASIARELIVAAGGFDEGFTEYGHEDLELLVRLRKLGVEPVFEPGAVARQTYGKTFAEYAVDMERVGRTSVQLTSRHPEATAEVTAFRDGSRAQRLALTALVAGARAGLPVTRLLVAAEARLARWAPSRMTRFYTLATELFFRLGELDGRAGRQ